MRLDNDGKVSANRVICMEVYNSQFLFPGHLVQNVRDSSVRLRLCSRLSLVRTEARITASSLHCAHSPVPGTALAAYGHLSRFMRQAWILFATLARQAVV
jgi:hypothetical protein